MKSLIHRADGRGVSELGWLHSRHSFSFAEYYDHNKTGFGLLRVFNDDIVEPGQGFGTHPHNNMEIISIVLEGALEHKDSMGSGSIIRPDDVQVMSAGTGITHSEFNHSKLEEVKFLQIWISPKERNITPRYDQQQFPLVERKSTIKKVAAGNKNNETLYIHQDAAVSLGNLDAGNDYTYKLSSTKNGIYLFVLNGDIGLDNIQLSERDAAGLSDVDSVIIKANSCSNFVVIEVPMN